jgi:hypothetical protein
LIAGTITALFLDKTSADLSDTEFVECVHLACA